MIKDRAHRVVAYAIEVGDAVGAGDHPGSQRPDLAAGVCTFVGGHAQVLVGQIQQAGSFGQGHDRDQSGVRHEIGVIEPRRRYSTGMSMR